MGNWGHLVTHCMPHNGSTELRAEGSFFCHDWGWGGGGAGWWQKVHREEACRTEPVTRSFLALSSQEGDRDSRHPRPSNLWEAMMKPFSLDSLYCRNLWFPCFPPLHLYIQALLLKKGVTCRDKLLKGVLRQWPFLALCPLSAHAPPGSKYTDYRERPLTT